MEKIDSLTDFIEKIVQIGQAEKAKHIVYRGHSLLKYKLEPSVFRKIKWREAEHLMLRQMIAENPFEFANDPTTFDKLVRAQHYGLPTRLLDVSINPLVGLYFACNSNTRDDGKVLIVKTNKQRHRYFDSDTISLMANMAFLKRSEKEALYSYAKSHGNGATIAERVESYADSPALDRLIQTLRAEKPHFRPEVDPVDLAYVASVTPKKSHNRIRAQDGQFLIFGMMEASTGEHMKYIDIEELIVPAEIKENLIQELALLGVSESVLFPEIDKSASQLAKKYT